MEQKRKLEKLLKKYGVEKPEEIEEKIKQGLLPEHPAYEDFLSALAYQKNISELKAQSKKIAPEIRLKRYHALLNRISKSPEVDVTPDELISLLKSM